MDKPLILVIDDTPKNLQLIGTILRDKGYALSMGSNGAQGVELALKAKPDLILLDVMMPEMDGFETCEKLKSYEILKDTPVIFLTAKSELDDITRGFDAGAVDYVVKPFQQRELIKRIESHLELKNLRDLHKQESQFRKELLHIICHDLVNPIGACTFALQMLEMSPENSVEINGLLKTNLQHGLDIIQVVREMLALDSGKRRLDLLSYSLSELVSDASVILRNKFEKKSITLDLDIDITHMVYVEHVSFINSVLNNLFTNAIKFSDENDTVYLKSYSEGKTTTLEVSDHGIGMNKFLIEKLFDPTQQTNRTGTSGEVGTGFGMPLIKKFIESYGGSIEVFSKEKTDASEDHGTKVKIILKSEK